MQSTTTTRRSALRTLAGATVLTAHTPALAAIAPDPVFAAIELHRHAWDWLGRCCTVASDIEGERYDARREWRPEPADLPARLAAAEAERNRAGDGEFQALWELVTIEPTTAGGSAARLEYFAKLEETRFELWANETDDGQRADVALMTSTARAIRKLGGVS